MNVRQGEDAFVINSDYPENLGAIVHVEYPIGLRKLEGGATVFCWHVRTQGGPLLGFLRDPTKVHPTMEAICPDFCLRPIRPGELERTPTPEALTV